MTDPIAPPPPHLLKKFSTEARDESNKRNGAGYLKTFARLCIEWANSKSTPNSNQIRSSDITPPPELVQQWLDASQDGAGWPRGWPRKVATCAAQWGADTELEACCEWLHEELKMTVLTLDVGLRAARRPSPKPPSLKAQAQSELNRLIALIPSEGALAMAEPIRRALNKLPDN